MRGLIVGAIRQSLQREGDRASTTGAGGMLRAFRPGFSPQPAQGWSAEASPSRPLHGGAAGFGGGYTGSFGAGAASAAVARGFGEVAQAAFDSLSVPTARSEVVPAQPAGQVEAITSYPLGAARAQVHANYIVAQTADGLVIVDQHAAHERLVFEQMRKALSGRRLPSQGLLIPEIVDLPEEDCDRLMTHAEGLEQLGLAIERFGPGAIAVRETPAMLGEMDTAGLVRDLADEIAEWDTADRLNAKLEHVAATMACHGSVRSGRQLRVEEMNALLRQMEQTPGSGQCNHGRPTYVELKLSDIERLFGRS